MAEGIILQNKADNIVNYDINFDAYVVHVGFNRNGHYFSANELSSSYITLIGQPINIRHDQSKVVGVINSANYIDNDGIVINASVFAQSFRRVFGDNKYECELANVESGYYKLSMECKPSDVSIILKEVHSGKRFVVDINDDTAHLLLNIPVFGGNGFIGNTYQVGLYLKDIAFVGAALTETPADGNAKIIQFNYGNHKMVANLEEKSMSKELEEKVTMLEKSLAELQSSYKEIQASFEEAQKEIEKLSNDVKSKDDRISELVATNEALVSDKETLEASLSEANEQLGIVQSEKDSVIKELEEAKASLTLLSRKEKIRDFNVEIEDKELLAFTAEAFDVYVKSLEQVVASRPDGEQVNEGADDKSEEDLTKSLAQAEVDNDDGLPANDIEPENYGKKVLNGLKGL